MTTPARDLISGIRRRRSGEISEVAAQIRELCYRVPLQAEPDDENRLYHDAEVLTDALNHMHHVHDKLKEMLK